MVKYDPVLGAFRTIDDGSVSLNGNTDTIFAGSGLLMSINETGFQTNWSPNFSVNTNLSDVLFSVMQRFDNDEFANATAHLDFIRRLDALEKGNSGGASNITVNGISPDPGGNIQLNTENITFNLKDSWGNDFPISSAISNTNLQEFFVSMQSAVFSVDGQSVRMEDGVYTGDIELKYSCRYDGWIAQMIANEYYEGQVNPDQYEESHILIHEILDRYSCYRVNDKSAGEYNPGEIRLTACDIPLGYYNDEYGNEYPDISINDAITLMMSPPDYASPDTSTYELHTQYMTDRHGWVIVKIFAGEDDGFAFVCFEGSKEMYYTPFKAGGVASICFPVGNFTTWEIVDGGDPVSDATYEILFVPCYTASYY